MFNHSEQEANHALSNELSMNCIRYPSLPQWVAQKGNLLFFVFFGPLLMCVVQLLLMPSSHHWHRRDDTTVLSCVLVGSVKQAVATPPTVWISCALFPSFIDCLMEVFRVIKLSKFSLWLPRHLRREETVKEEASRGLAELRSGPKLDLSFKEGQTITINVPVSTVDISLFNVSLWLLEIIMVILN